jgi:hypothetical protein
MARARWGAIAAACVALTGCGAKASDPRAAEPPIVAVWRARCGACHVPIQPGERTAPALRAAAKRHEKRVRLAAAQWDELIAWLAPAR